MADPLDFFNNTFVAPGEELGAEGFIPAGALKASSIQSAVKAAEVSEKAQQKVGQLTASALLRQRREALERDVLRGVEQMTARNALLADMRYGQLRENTASRQREAGELAGDTYVSLEGGTVNLTAGIPLAALDITTSSGGVVNAPSFVEAPVQALTRGVNRILGTTPEDHARGRAANEARVARGRYQTDLIRDNVLEPAQQLLGEYNQARQKRMSAVSQADMEIFSEENQIAAAASKAKAEQEIADGDNAFMANLRRVGRDALHDGGNLLGHPTTFGNVLTEQVPSLATGFAGRAAVTAGAIRSGARVLAQKEGKDLMKLPPAERRELLQRAQKQAETRALAGVVGITEGGAAYSEAAGEVWNTDLGELIQDNPEAQEAYREIYLAYMRQEMPPEQAAEMAEEDVKAELASRRGLTRMAIVAPTAGVISRLGAGFQLDPLRTRNRAAAAVTSASPADRLAARAAEGLRKDFMDVLGEVGEESLQGGVSSVAGNVAKALSGDENVDYAEGVGGEIGVGAVAAGGLSGGLRSPSIAANTAIGVAADAPRAAKEAAALGVKAAGKLFDRVDRPFSEAQSEADKQTLNELKKTTDTLQTNSTKASENAEPITAESEPVLTKSLEDRITNNGESPVMSPYEVLSRLIVERKNYANPTTDAEREDQTVINNAIFKYARDLEREASASDNQDFKDAAETLLSREELEQTIAGLRQIPKEVIDQVVADIRTPTQEELGDGTTALARERLVQYLSLNPTGLDANTVQEVAESPAMQDLSPEDRKVVEVAAEQARNLETLDSELTASGYVPNKQSSAVAREVRDSLIKHVNDISEAMSVGAVQRAMPAFRKLIKFAQGAQTRAQAFDLAAAEHIANGSSKDEDVQVAVGGTIGEDGRLDRSRPFSFNINNEGARRTLDNVFSDTRAIARAANSMLRHYPELQRAFGQALPELNEALKPGYETLPDNQAAAAYAAELRGRLSLDQPAQQAPAPTVEPEAPQAAPQTAPEPVAAPAQSKAPEKAAPAPQTTLRRKDVEGWTDPQISHRLRELNAIKEKTAQNWSDFNLLKAVAADRAKQAKQPESKPEPEKAKAETKAPEQDVSKLTDEQLAQELDTATENSPRFKELEAELDRRLVQELQQEPEAEIQLDPEETPTVPAKETVEVDVDAMGLITQLGRSVNKFTDTFSLRKKATGLFARIPTDPLGTVLDALKEGKLADLLPKSRRYLAENLSDEKRMALEYMLGDGVKTLTARMNQSLNETSLGTHRTADGRPSKSKGWKVLLGRNYNDGGAVWDFPLYRQLHLVQANEDGTFSYQPHVLEAAATAALRWAATTLFMNPRYEPEKISQSLFNGNPIPTNLVEHFKSMHHYVQPTRQLAGDIAQLLGLQGKDDAPLDYVDGMMKALAADALRALVDEAFVERKAFTLPATTVQAKDGQTVQDLAQAHGVTEAMIRDANPNLGGILMNGQEVNIPASREQMVFVRFTGNQTFDLNSPKGINAPALKKAADLLPQTLLTNLLMPGSQDQVFLGEPSTAVPTHTTGSRMPLVKFFRDGLKNRNKEKFTYNNFYGDLIDHLGEDFFKDMHGYEPESTETNTIRARWSSLLGKKAGIDAAFSRAADLKEQLKSYMEAHGIEKMQDVPMYFSWRAISNTRSMMNGAGPQSDKHLRELFTPNKVTIDVTDADMVTGFYLIIGQAIGLKTEYLVPDVVQQEVVKKLTGRTPGDKALRRAFKQLREYVKTGKKIKQADFLADLREAGMDNPRGLDGLLTYARFLENSESTFSHSMPLELDGKTDGVINSLYHFGIRDFSAKSLKQLRQGGIIINAKDGADSLSTIGKKQGDAYSNTTNRGQEILARRVDSPATPQAIKQLYLVVGQLLLDTGNASLKDADLLTEDNLSSQLVFARDVVKPGTMTTNYGSGTTAMVWELVHNLVAQAIEEMDAAHREGRPMDEYTKGNLQMLMGYTYDIDGTPDKRTRQDMSKLEDPSTWIGENAFYFTNQMLENMHANMMNTMGGVIAEAVQEEMADTIAMFQKAYSVSALFYYKHKKMYEAEIEKYYKEAEKKNKFARYNAPPRKVINEILEKLKPYAPIFEIQHGQEVSLSGSDNTGKFLHNGTPIRVGALAGGFGMDIAMPNLKHPRVSFASQLTIALGDAAMMATMWQQLRKALDVFDGFEASNDRLFQDAHDINKAVWDNYQFDVMGKLKDKYATFEMDFNQLTTQELIDVAWGFGLEGAYGASRTKLLKFVEEESEKLKSTLEYDARKVRYTKEAISNINNAIDHMASANRPYYTNPDGLSFDTDEEVVAYIQDFVSKKLEADKKATAAQAKTEAKPNQSTKLKDGTEQHTGLTVMGREQFLRYMSGHKFENALTKSMYGFIKHLIPKGLTIVQGDAESLKQFLESKGLNPDVAFRGRFIQMTDGNDFMLLRSNSESTLIHELIHATTLTLMRAYYQPELGLKLNDSQKTAIQNLEKLARAFLKMPTMGMARFAHAQSVVQRLFDEGKAFGAVNEFMAYTLSEYAMAKRLNDAPPVKGIMATAVNVLNYVRKLLGIPNNKTNTDMLEQALTNTFVLVRNQARPLTYTGTEFMDSGFTPEPSDDGLLDRIDKQLTAMVVANNQSLAGLDDAARIKRMEQGVKAAKFILKSREDFKDAGFEMDEIQERLFDRIHTVFMTVKDLDPNVMTQLQKLYNEVIDHVSQDTFLDDPTTTDPNQRASAHAQYQALINPAKGPDGRSAMLANFIALALTNEKLQAVLEEATPARENVREGDLNDRARAAATNVMNVLAEVATHSRGMNQKQALQTLMLELGTQHEREMARQKRNASTGPINTMSHKSREALRSVGTWAEERQRALGDPTTRSTINKFVGSSLGVVAAITKAEKADSMQEAILSMLNTRENIPTFVRDVIADAVGNTDSKLPVNMLLNKVKHMVSRIRQRLRDEAPKLIRSWFKQPLTKEEWKVMNLMAKGDFQTLYSDKMNVQKLARMLEDDAALVHELSKYDKLWADHPQWQWDADDLAKTMIHGGNESLGLFKKNAHAIVRGAGSASVLDADDPLVVRHEAQVDRYTSLKSIQHMNKADRQVLAEIIKRDGEAVTKTLATLNFLVQEEKRKPDAARQLLNSWKGELPRSVDPRSHIVLRHRDDTKKLLKMGYEKIADYKGDSLDKFGNEYSYFKANLNIMGVSLGTAGQANYAQGAMQTVEATVLGADRIGGISLREDVSSVIKSPRGVSMITEEKLEGAYKGTHNLIPVFNERGEVVMYERPLHRHILDAHLKGREDLAASMGMWFGRQAEEAMAREMNTQVIKAVHNNYLWAKEENKLDEYVNVADPKNPIARETWEAIPREAQLELVRQFNPEWKEGDPMEVWVRKSAVNNTLGYRAASVADVFTGKTQLPEDVRKAIEGVAYTLMGKRAYQILTVGEKTWQGVIGTAKDWIIVRSGTVAIANGLSNQVQLLQLGIPVRELLTRQSKKFLEAETYFRNEKRQTEIAIELRSTNNPNQIAKLNRELQALHDSNSRLSIMPLIEAGQLPTITEGLAENDEYTYTADFTDWLEKQSKKMPKGLMTAAQYALVSKDTALYQGMNRFIQLSDFVARAVAYDKLLADGKTEEQAIAETDELFVNYNYLAGRSRDYLESMGIGWFWNYKLRIQKIALRALRDNPLSFFTGGIVGGILDIDSLISSSAFQTNYGYSIGLGQFYRASEMNMWREVTGL